MSRARENRREKEANRAQKPLYHTPRGLDESTTKWPPSSNSVAGRPTCPISNALTRSACAPSRPGGVGWASARPEPQLGGRTPSPATANDVCMAPVGRRAPFRGCTRGLAHQALTLLRAATAPCVDTASAPCTQTQHGVETGWRAMTTMPAPVSARVGRTSVASRGTPL